MSNITETTWNTPDVNQTVRTSPLRTIVIHNRVEIVDSVRDACRDNKAIEVVADCISAFEVENAVGRHSPDLILLGIGLSDMEVVKKSIKESPILTFVIDDRQSDINLIKFCDIDFIAEGRGFESAQISELVNEAKKRLHRNHKGDLAIFIDLASGRAPVRKREKIAFKSGRRYVVMEVGEIYWMEKEGNGTRIHTAEHSYLTSVSLSEFVAKPQLRMFSLISPGESVNIRHVREIRSLQGVFHVILDNRVELRVVRQYRKLKRLVGELWK